MAAGNGDSFLSFTAGLENRLALRVPVRGCLNKSCENTEAVTSKEYVKERRLKECQSLAEWLQVYRTESSNLETVTKVPEKIMIESILSRLPPEILKKIISYLDASSLFCLGQVSKYFRQVANDNFIWQKLFLCDFGMWTPELPQSVPVKANSPVIDNCTANRWKKMYLKTVNGFEVKMWRTKLRSISPYNGLPDLTTHVLRKLNVTWELTVCKHSGQRIMLNLSKVFFTDSSVIVCWSASEFLSHSDITGIWLYGIRKPMGRSSKSQMPRWRSLMLSLDMRTCPQQLVGRDRLITLFILPPGVIIGIWTSRNAVAFIMTCLHFHKLVERSLLASPACPYMEAVLPPSADDKDPKLGLHGYSLHFLLHNNCSEIILKNFSQLSTCSPALVRNGLVELKFIDRTSTSRHRPLSGRIQLPWRCGGLNGAVENCCIMTFTLLDESLAPFWCISSLVSMTAAANDPTLTFDGKPFVIEHQNPDGQVKIELIKLKGAEQFFIVGLTLNVFVAKINKHFHRKYR